MKSMQRNLITTSTYVLKHEEEGYEIIAYVTDSNDSNERGVWLNAKVTANFPGFLNAMGEVMNEISVTVAENGTVAKP